MIEDQEHFDLRGFWVEAERREKAYQDKGDAALIAQMADAYRGLRACGWKDIIYCPKDGTTFLGLEAGNTKPRPCFYQGTWPKGSWWIASAGDLWPGYPILWRPDDGDATKAPGPPEVCDE